MFDDSLLLHLLLSFLLGSLWVTLVTVIAERRGSTVGGILVGFPSTAAFSFLFIGINQSLSDAVEATTLFPIAFSVTSAFLLFFTIFARKRFSVGLTLSLLIWFLASSLIVVSGLKDFAFSLVSGLLITAAVYFIINRLHLENLTGKKKPYNLLEILGRGIGAGSLVLLAVLLSQIGGPILGGIATAFPAVFTSTLIILNKNEGLEFSRAITKPLVMSGIFTIIPFSVAIRYFYPIMGIWLGTLSAYAIISPLAILSYLLVHPRRK